MERKYKEAIAGLNAEQKTAVQTIDGPVLVMAGPGTGKTQLISARAGYILKNTDTPPEAILLLTFTEAGAAAMRDRLNRLIGKPAYDIQINTYHAFGGEIFRRYPDYFDGAQLNLIEELGFDSLLREIIAKLPYSNPLKFADNYLNDLKSFISEAKRSLLSPEDIEQIAQDNLKFLRTANKNSRKVLDKLTVVSKKSLPVFEDLLTVFASIPQTDLPVSVLPLAQCAQAELQAALDFFNESAKTTSLTEWKRQWLAKDSDGRFIIEGARQNQRLAAAAGIYRQYQRQLKSRKLYDYDDMILRAIDLLETNRDLKYSLAERYSYIMLDEFQDTNPAQFKLVQLLTDHPVHEGRPNILAVGDDDQAIYAFQGADHANMSAFARHYKNVKIISLKQNYRAHQELLDVGTNIAAQIQSRLHHQFKGVTKQLLAANKDLPKPPQIQMRQFKSDAAQYAWIAKEITKITKQGIPAREIAVLAPKHRYLAPLLPYLADQKIAIRYERRENILDEPIIYQLEQMSRLVLALADSNESLASALWPEILSYGFWDVPTEKIWRAGWQSRESHEPWTAILLNDETIHPIASFFLRLAALLPVTSLEQQLDALTGVPEMSESLKLPLKSPLYEYYFSKSGSHTNPQEFIKLISDLNVLRARLREWHRSFEQKLTLRALVEFIQGHREARLNILNTSPYHDTAQAVNLITAYGAKGREFQAVFVIAANDEVWGNASRNQGYRLSLPANLSYIRYQGASEDERLRLLFVAATRARSRLFFTSYGQELSGKAASQLKYLDIEENETGRLTANVLPDGFREVIIDDTDSPPVQTIANYWTDKHNPPFTASLKEALAPRLERYQLSATHLNKFTDVVNGGPDKFFMDCLLNFPSAPSLTSAFGTAIHNSLRFAGHILISEGSMPPLERLMEIFDAQLGRIELPSDEQANLRRRGQDSLRVWLAQARLSPSDRFEYDFQNEGSTSGAARLSGKVDRIIIDEKRRKLTVVDYKTGQSYRRWQASVIKLHKFRQQLMLYKLLIESSARFRKYEVEKGIIEFVEPDEDGRINRLELIYDDAEVKYTASLIGAVWDRVQTLNFPDIDTYQPTLGGIRNFETDLITQPKSAGPAGA